jgi:pyruvate dehydrogenase E1 component beta subunit
MTMVQAIQDALRIALREDPRVVLLGEDVGKNGGVFRVTEGLQAEFGAERVADTPLAENGIVGGAIGMALYGMKPVAEIQFVDFIYPPSIRSSPRWPRCAGVGGPVRCPVVVRAPLRRRHSRGASIHRRVPRRTSATPPGPHRRDPRHAVRGQGPCSLAIAGEDPVIFLEPSGSIEACARKCPRPLHHADFEGEVVREGTQCTVIAYGAWCRWRSKPRRKPEGGASRSRS